MKIPKGFRFGGVACGIKPQRRDLALVVSDHPAAAAGVFTVNKAAAAPVIDGRPRVPAEGMRAVVVNSGNANALTGPGGIDDVGVIRGAVADALGIQKRSVLSASTGVIGQRLPAMKILAALPALAEQLGDHSDLAAEAIMTTDTRPKMAAREVTLGGKPAVISCIAKGSGMLAPQLATTLCVVTTDAAITPRALQDALVRAVATTFNMVSVDGDMSTNDTVYALANGLAGNPRMGEPGVDLDVFEAALRDLLGEMARAMAADGEGATRMIEVVVTGAPDDACARDLARAIATSPLVKAAIFGADPNWGRILATVGARAGSQGFPVDPFKARVAPFNVNYRYVAEELRYLLNDSGAEAIVVHSQFAPVLAEAVLLSEDANFFGHEGLDWVAIRDAAEHDLRAGRFARGASTLTQQLAKNLWLGTEKSLWRKAREAVLAAKLERALGKRRILAIYLNVVELDDGVFGMEAGARHRFGTSAAALTPAQAVVLASLLPAPRRVDLARPSTWLKERSRRLLDLLRDTGRLPPAEHLRASAELERILAGPAPADDRAEPPEEAERAQRGGEAHGAT